MLNRTRRPLIPALIAGALCLPLYFASAQEAADGVVVLEDDLSVADEEFAWSEFINKARAKYMKGKLFREKAQRGYRDALSEVVKAADEVHVFLLDSDLEKLSADLPPAERFPIRPYGADARILKTKVLKGDACRELAQALADGLAEDIRGAGAKCHLPVYGVRVYRKDELPFQTSLCWECENYYVDYPDHSSWQEMGPAFNQLLPLLESVMPRES